MRELMVKQKKLIDKWIKDNMRELRGVGPSFEYENYITDLGFPIEKLEAINNTEVLWQEINRYVRDYLSSVAQETADMFREEGR